ncbi:MAG: hypothetical protein Q4C54_01200, partial [Clostridia bacterium]|nr:hypothetical protein [Clostridia bacterium]
MKKLLSLLLVFSMLFTMMPFAFASAELVLEDLDDDEFEDIDEDEFADVNTSDELDAIPDRVGRVVLNAEEKRGIKLQPVGLNEVEEGISPTTGLPLEDYDLPSGFGGLAATGHYQPILVQIDNTNGGVNYDTNNCAPWGASYADIVYETPLHRSGFT